MAAPTADRERNSTRTREAVLDAAERLFAERGYEATSLSDLGREAGVSRGTPGYFFGSKDRLYRAVLERCLERVRTAVRSGRERALASRESPEVVLAGAVGEYFDFINANPFFVRLLEWEALAGGNHLAVLPPHLEAAQEALGAIVTELALDPGDETEARQLLLSMLALSWFHLVHGPTVLRALGVDPASPAFQAERRRHVVNLVVQGVRGRWAARAPGNESEPPAALAGGEPAPTPSGRGTQP
ncbi:MAG TPA: TetR/AcrR family transcriptional regulator [Gemmatimonadales bacterium]|nr:TetR/AcrR family transcriptional regulator [Gemmatimonadales bacterium]